MRKKLKEKCTRFFGLSLRLFFVVFSLIISGYTYAEIATVINSLEHEEVSAEFDSAQYKLLENVPSKYKKYNVEPWNLLKLPDFKKSYWDALKPINKKKLTPYVRNLDVIWSPDLNSACITPQGIAMIYNGSKPRWTTDSLRIVFFPNSKMIAIRIEDEFVKYQNGDFGKLDDSVLKILDGSVCNLGER